MNSVASYKAKLAQNLQQQSQKQALKDLSDSDSSDDEVSEEVISSTFRNYKGTIDDIKFSVTDQLVDAKNARCLICLEKIRVDASTWQCDECYCLLHLGCIRSWIQNRALDKSYTLTEQSFPNRKKMANWMCPKCRSEYSHSQVPTKYYCFCGKEEDPSYNVWAPPHSCGNICGKSLSGKCGHTCTLLCHPGRCPPCPQTVRQSCYCGQDTTVRRCSSKFYSCNGMCEKLLACGIHKCEKICHQGDCPPCMKESMQYCQCKREKQMRPCYQLNFQCGKVCKKPYSCGKHVCEKVCHSGDCGPCPGTLPRACFCGKSKFNIPCDKPTPACQDTCDKFLNCGVHHCPDKCHKGECGSCRMFVTKTCKCGKSKKSDIPCYKEYICEKKCTLMRNCNRHQCKKKCCRGDCPPCGEICDRPLKCGNHRCTSVCHDGPCLPCGETWDLACYCKKIKKTVPCGSVVKLPKCREYCAIPPFCHHTSKISHRCHYGPCPPCKYVCNISHNDCPHTCTALCHDVLPAFKYLEFKYKSKKKTVVKYPNPVQESQVVCPPCQVKVKRFCEGKHQEYDVTCSSEKDFCCGRKCGNLLECGNHSCDRLCHKISQKREIEELDNGDQQVVISEDSDENSPDTCVKCEEPCKKPRKCKHECYWPCHLNDCPPCEERVRVVCFCSKSKLLIKCCDTQEENRLNSLRSCKGLCQKELPNCPHLCAMVCHNGECSAQCEQTFGVVCKCGRIKQKWPCVQAQKARKEQNITDKEYKSLIKCDEECERIKAEKLLAKQLAAAKEEESAPKTAEKRVYVKKYKQKKSRMVEEAEEPKSYTMYYILSVVILLIAILVCLYIQRNGISINNLISK